jgi:Transmembrane secretion effector
LHAGDLAGFRNHQAVAADPEKPLEYSTSEHRGAGCAGAAMRHPGFRMQFVTLVFAMMADNIEHVISYWMMFQKFHSPALAGFAIVSHWLPFLLFSVAAGRLDPRRIIQCGMLLFVLVSLGWGYFFITDTLQMWQAMGLLVIHGCAGVLWFVPVQVLLYDIVGPADLISAVRLNATARHLGVLVGPAAGGFILLAPGPSYGIFLNTIFYLPMVLMAGERAIWAALPQRRGTAAPCGAWLRRYRPYGARNSRPFPHHLDDDPG